MSVVDLLGGLDPGSPPSRHRALLLRDRAAFRADLAARQAVWVLVDDRQQVLRVEGRAARYGVSQDCIGDELTRCLPMYLCLPALSAIERVRQTGVGVVERDLADHASLGEACDLHVVGHARGRHGICYSLMLTPRELEEVEPTAEMSLTEATAIALERARDEQRSNTHETEQELARVRESTREMARTLRDAQERLRATTIQHRLRKEATAARREMLNAVFAGARVGAVLTDRDGRVRRFTHSVCAHVHLGGDDLGRAIEDVQHSLHADVASLVRSVLEAGEVLRRAVPTTAGDMVLLQLAPLPQSEDGGGALLLVVDLDTATRARRALADHHRRLELIHGPQGLATWSWTSRGFERSCTLSRALGLDNGCHDLEALRPVLGGAAETLWQALEGTPSGEQVRIDISVAGRVLRWLGIGAASGHVVGVMTPVSEASGPALERLREMEAEGDGGVLLDLQGVVTRVGATAAAFLDVREAELRGRSLRSVPSALGSTLGSLVSRALSDADAAWVKSGVGGLAEIRAERVDGGVSLRLVPAGKDRWPRRAEEAAHAP